MASVTMATSEWIQFFKEAGIPPGPAVNYAVTFVDNRIRKNMLLDLNKEIMNELGVTVVGDIIAILKHAKVVYRQEMCKAATESLNPASPSLPPDFRRNANSAASRMIANSLRRESPPAPRNPTRASKISVTVSNKLARAGSCGSEAGIEATAPKRRRVTAEMEGKYVITMPKGTTPRSRKILEQQAARGSQRTSVFERLGAEAKADTTTGAKPTGVFSRLGDTPSTDGAKTPASDDGDDGDGDDGSVLQYAGVLKKPPKRPQNPSAQPGAPVKAKATSSEAKPIPVATKPQRRPAPKPPRVVESPDDAVSSTKDKPPPEFRVTIKRTWGSGKVSSTSDNPGARMDSAGAVSVFQRLGRKTD